MSKLDKLKEIINTLRGFFVVTMALIVTVTSGLIDRFDEQRVDAIFTVGVILDLFLILLIILFVNRIVKRTRELEDL